MGKDGTRQAFISTPKEHSTLKQKLHRYMKTLQNQEPRSNMEYNNMMRQEDYEGLKKADKVRAEEKKSKKAEEQSKKKEGKKEGEAAEVKQEIRH